MLVTSGGSRAKEFIVNSNIIINSIIKFSYYKRRLLTSSKCLLSDPINCPEVYSLSSRQYC